MLTYLSTYKVRLLVALAVAAYLRFLLPVTAVGFYELYHLSGIDAVYWGYSLFKVAGYYFGEWEGQTTVCIVVAVVIAVPWLRLLRRRSNASGTSV